MADDTKAKRRGNSKPNVKRRGSTYTYYVYVIGPDGKRRQHSKGGFKTQREAEDATPVPPDACWASTTCCAMLLGTSQWRTTVGRCGVLRPRNSSM